MKTEIIYKSLPIVVEYKYIPAERCVRYENDLSGYPGSSEQIEIYNIYHAGEDITDFIAEISAAWGEIEDLVLEKIHEND